MDIVKKFFFGLTILLASATWSNAVVPTVHRWNTGPSDATLGSTQLQIHTASGTASGNALILGCTYDGSRAISSTKDDKSGKWTVAVTSTDATNNQKFSILYSTGVSVGVSSVTVVFDAATSFAQCAIIEMNNIATGSAASSIIDKTTGGRFTGTAIACGPMNLGTAGDEVIHFFVSDGTLPNAFVNFTTGTVSSGTTDRALFGLDNNSIWGSEYYNVTGTGVIDSTITASSSLNSTVGACAAFKTASNGGAVASTGIDIQQSVFFNLNDPQDYTGKTAFKFDFPVQADSNINTILLIEHVSGAPAVSTITSSPANVWVSSVNTVGANDVGAWYVVNAVTNSTMTITVTLTVNPLPTSNAFTGMIYGLSGVATSNAVDNICSKSFTSVQTSGTVRNQPDCLVTTPNSLLIEMQQEDRQTVVGGSPGFQMEGDTAGPYSSFDYYQDGGNANYWVGASSTVVTNWEYAFYEGGGPIGSMTGLGIAFKPGTAAPATVLGTNKQRKYERLEE